jgi:hypothetical protein
MNDLTRKRRDTHRLVLLAAICLVASQAGCSREAPHVAKPQTTRPPKPAPMADTFRVVLGKSVGPVALGMTEKKAVAAGDSAWGPRSLLNEQPMFRHWEYQDPRVTIVFATRAFAGAMKEGKRRKQQVGDEWVVFSITVGDKRFKTASGFGVGTSYTTAKKVLGKPSGIRWQQRDGIMGTGVPGYGEVYWPHLQVEFMDSRVTEFSVGQ